MPQIIGKEVGSTAYGLMGLTWRPTQTPDTQAFAAMKKALELGANLWNSGEFYGTPDPTLNLQLLNRYFTQYPEDASKVVLSVKGAVDIKILKPTGTPEGIKTSIENILKILDGKKHLDIFECARVDPEVPIEQTIATIAEYVKAGKISGIGLSECSAKTIRRAHAVHPIAAVEVEFSLWSTEILENDVASTCAELGIPIVAYSPLGRGFLTGQIKSIDDIPEGDFRRHFDRFLPENFQTNLELVKALEKIAEKKKVTPAQLALGWVKSYSGKNGLIIIPLPGATHEARVEENMKDVILSEEDSTEIKKLLSSIPIKGGRYNQHAERLLWG